MSQPALQLSEIAAAVQHQLSPDPTWVHRFTEAGTIHLAILIEPFLTYLLERRKTVESRFAKNRSAPFRKVSQGDVVILKRAGGPVVGVIAVGKAESLALTEDNWKHVKRFSTEICADDAFWAQRSEKRFATLLFVEDVRSIAPVRVEKRDRRPWVVLKDRQLALDSPCASS